MRIKRAICMLALVCLLAAALPTPGQTALAASGYYITVDLTNQIVTVYNKGDTSDAGIVRQMICSSGRSSTPTPTGTYTLPAKTYSSERKEWYYFPKYNCYAKWATRIIGGILFHSVLYTAAKKGPTKASVNALGSKASHGCVRLRVADSRWIAENCLAGTQCRIFYSGKTNAALRKKLLKKSFSADEQTYDEFLGKAGAAQSGIRLSKGSKGDKVRQLQSRLKALGFLNDTVDGKFGTKTETAVKYFQAACGLGKTGKVNDDLWERLFADDAPVGTWVTLSQKMSGPAVARLQKALVDLKLLEEPADDSYDARTADAVKRYQEAFGFSATGKANQALQEDILERVDELKTRFGEGGYQLLAETEAVAMARVKVKSYTYLRAKASTKGKKLAKLKNKAQVTLLSVGKTWSNVEYEGRKGYVQNKLLVAFTGERTVLRYEAAASPEPTITPSPTPEISLPTPTSGTPDPSPSPEVYIPVSSPATSAEPSPSPSPSPTVDWLAVISAPSPEDSAGDGAPADDSMSIVSAPAPLNLDDEGAPEGADGDAAAAPAEAPVEEREVPLAPEDAPAAGQPAEQPQQPLSPEAAEQPEAGPDDVPAAPDAQPAEQPDGEAPVPPFAVISRDGATLYARPEADALAALQALPAGTVLEALALRGDWIEVRCDFGAAFVSAADAALTDAPPAGIMAPAAADGPELQPGTEPAPEPTPVPGVDEATGLILEYEQDAAD